MTLKIQFCQNSVKVCKETSMFPTMYCKSRIFGGHFIFINFRKFPELMKFKSLLTFWKVHCCMACSCKFRFIYEKNAFRTGSSEKFTKLNTYKIFWIYSTSFFFLFFLLCFYLLPLAVFQLQDIIHPVNFQAQFPL